MGEGPRGMGGFKGLLWPVWGRDMGRRWWVAGQLVAGGGVGVRSECVARGGMEGTVWGRHGGSGQWGQGGQVLLLCGVFMLCPGLFCGAIVVWEWCDGIGPFCVHCVHVGVLLSISDLLGDVCLFPVGLWVKGRFGVVVVVGSCRGIRQGWLTMECPVPGSVGEGLSGCGVVGFHLGLMGGWGCGGGSQGVGVWWGGGVCGAVVSGGGGGGGALRCGGGVGGRVGWGDGWGGVVRLWGQVSVLIDSIGVAGFGSCVVVLGGISGGGGPFISS
ncbi:hypothetical protein Tco_0039783 [Tanacetum coccineum]